MPSHFFSVMAFLETFKNILREVGNYLPVSVYINHHAERWGAVGVMRLAIFEDQLI
jgi:hypothetical protein